MLDAALLEQAAPRSPLRRAGNLLAVQQHVGTHWIGEAGIGRDAALRRPRTAQRAVPTTKRELGLLSDCSQTITHGAVNFFVDRHRRFSKRRILRGNHNAVGKIFAMENNSAARPTPNEVTI